MAKFTDRLGREWNLSLDMGLISKVRKSHDIHLGKILADKNQILSLIFEDVDKFWTVLVAMTESKRTELKVSIEDFESGFDGETMEACRLAVLESIANFSHPRIAKQLVASLGKVMDANLEKAKADHNQTIEKLLTTLNESAGNSPASAA